MTKTTDPNTAVTEDAEWLRLLAEASKAILPRFTDADRERFVSIADRLVAMKSAAPQHTGLTDVERVVGELSEWFAGYGLADHEWRGIVAAIDAVQQPVCADVEGNLKDAYLKAAEERTRLREALEKIAAPLGNPPEVIDGEDAANVIRWWRGVAVRCREIANSVLDTPTSDKGEEATIA